MDSHYTSGICIVYTINYPNLMSTLRLNTFNNSTTLRGTILKKRIVFGILAFIYVLIIFFLTCQGMKETEALSDGVNSIVQKSGIIMPEHDLRNLFHVPMYFIFGILLLLFFDSMSWKLGRIIVLGSFVGFVDEFIKIFLPTREFDFFDLIRDFVGLLLAFIFYVMIKEQFKRRRIIGEHHEKNPRR